MRRDTRHGHARRRLGMLTAVVVLLVAGVYVSVSVGQSDPPHAHAAGVKTKRTRLAATHAQVAQRLLVSAPGRPTMNWKVVAQVRGQPAAWIAQRSEEHTSELQSLRQ